MGNSFHLVDLRNKDYPYTQGWIDRSDAVLLANFALLKDFVEKEDPYKWHYHKEGRKSPRRKGQRVWEYNAELRQREVGNEIWRLYTWWIKTRKKEHDVAQKGLMKIYHESEKAKSKTPGAPLIGKHRKWKDAIRAEDGLQRKDQKMLHRLIDIREHLWT